MGGGVTNARAARPGIVSMGSVTVGSGAPTGVTNGHAAVPYRGAPGKSATRGG